MRQKVYCVLYNTNVTRIEPFCDERDATTTSILVWVYLQSFKQSNFNKIENLFQACEYLLEILILLHMYFDITFLIANLLKSQCMMKGSKSHFLHFVLKFLRWTFCKGPFKYHSLIAALIKSPWWKMLSLLCLYNIKNLSNYSM